jgi:hypothetical protein
MPSVKQVSSRTPRRAGAPTRAVVALLGCAVALAGCGAVRVQPTTPSGSTTLASRGKVDSPLNVEGRLACIRSAHLPVHVVSPIELQIGAAPTGPTIVFMNSPGGAQSDQIEGKIQGAEVIGTAELYPNQGSDAELASLVACLQPGVQG